VKRASSLLHPLHCHNHLEQTVVHSVLFAQTDESPHSASFFTIFFAPSEQRNDHHAVRQPHDESRPPRLSIEQTQMIQVDFGTVGLIRLLGKSAPEPLPPRGQRLGGGGE